MILKEHRNEKGFTENILQVMKTQNSFLPPTKAFRIINNGPNFLEATSFVLFQGHTMIKKRTSSNCIFQDCKLNVKTQGRRTENHQLKY